jgi:hypothetical protein
MEKISQNILTGKARKIIELNVDKYKYICTTDYKTLEEIERDRLKSAPMYEIMFFLNKNKNNI